MNCAVHLAYDLVKLKIWQELRSGLPHASKESQQISYNVLGLPPCLEVCTVLQSIKNHEPLLHCGLQSSILTLKPCRILKQILFSWWTHYEVTILLHWFKALSLCVCFSPETML